MKLYRSCKLRDLTFTATGDIIVTPKHIQPWNITPKTRHVTTWFDKPIKNVYHDDVIVEAEFTPEEFGKMEYKQIIYATPSYDYEGSSEDEEIECQIDEYITSQPIKADKLYIDRNMTVEDFVQRNLYSIDGGFPYLIAGNNYPSHMDNFVEAVTKTEYRFSKLNNGLVIDVIEKLHRGDRVLVSAVKLAEIIPFEYTEDVEIFDIDDVVEEVK